LIALILNAHRGPPRRSHGADFGKIRHAKTPGRPPAHPKGTANGMNIKRKTICFFSKIDPTPERSSPAAFVHHRVNPRCDRASSGKPGMR
jgi:hypothetical protein